MRQAETSQADSTGGALLAGRYRLVERIGEGGMGVVYRAEQERPVRRTVVVKLIKFGIDTDEVVARFQRERQAMAGLDHPGIARLLDAGSTEGGRPYFVLEHVDGPSITAWCRARGAGLTLRLELFVQVCRAVLHAHFKGILHRDLKPANILVTEVDDKPQAKVIDFGIAKALGDVARQETLLTGTGQGLGTPTYMSPEQAKDPAGADTRSDVYSLGVVLFELLTGALPFDLDSFGRPLRQEHPMRPSTRIDASVPGGPNPNPRHYRATLRNELDWVVLKALEPDAANRYASPAELADDLERFLADKPTRVGRPGRWRRLTRFVRRHRSMVASVAAVVVVLIGGVVGTGWQAWRASRQRDQAEVVAQFLNETLLRASEPGRDGDAATVKGVRHLIDGAVKRLDAGDLRNMPADEIMARWTLGNAYRNLTLPGPAVEQFRRALALFDASPGTQPLRPRVRSDLAEALVEAGRVDEAVASLEGRTDLPVSTLRVLGDGMLRLGRHDRAQSFIDMATAALPDQPRGEKDTERVEVPLLQARLLAARARHAEAVRTLEPAYVRAVRVFGENDALTLRAAAELGWNLRLSGDVARARTLLARAAAGTAAALGDAHAQTIDVRRKLADAQRADGDLDGCRATLRDATYGARRLYGPGTPVVAELLRQQADTEYAEHAAFVALIQLQRLYGAAPSDQLRTLDAACAWHMREGRMGGVDGTDLFLWRYAVASSLRGTAESRAIDAALELVRACARWDHPDLALPALRHELDRLRSEGRHEESLYQDILVWYARCELSLPQGPSDEGRRALAELEARPAHWYVEWLRDTLDEHDGRWEAIVQRQRLMRPKLQDPNGIAKGVSRELRALARLGRADEGRAAAAAMPPIAELALAGRLGIAHQHSVALALVECGSLEAAERLYRLVLARVERNHGPGSEAVAMARLGLMRVLAERQHWQEYEWFAATYAEERPYLTGERKHEMVAMSLGLTRALMRGGRAEEARRFVDEAGRLAESAMYVRPVMRREVDEVAAELTAARTGVGGREP